MRANNDPWDACSARDDCTGFNADGALMFAAATADNILPTKGACLYVKKGACGRRAGGTRCMQCNATALCPSLACAASVESTCWTL